MNLIMLAGKEPGHQEYKALFKIGSKPMIHYPIESYMKSGLVNKVFVVGIPPEIMKDVSLPWKNKIEFIDVQGTLDKKMMYSEKFLNSGGIMTTCDIPFAKPESIKAFNDLCGDEDDVYIGMVSKKAMDREFPNNGRTYIPVNKGKFCIADIAIINPSIKKRDLSKLEELVSNRKNPIKQALKLSPLIIFKALFKRITFQDIQKLVKKHTGVNVKLVEINTPDLAFDVDKDFQLDYARANLGNIRT